MKRSLWLGFVLFVYVIGTGCGDTFRPIIIPNPPVFPNPRAAHTVVTISDNGTVSPGSAMVIDVSGDTDVSEANVGLAPVYAAQQSANQVLVVNHSVTGQQQDSLTQLNFGITAISGITTISLPPNSAPNFVALAPSSTTAYVSLPGMNEVAQVSTQSDQILATFTVGSNPVALAVTPDNTKLYVANEGTSPSTNGTISGFNTLDLSPRTVSPASTSSHPIWLVPRNDGQRVYVLEQPTGLLDWINTTSTAGPDSLSSTTISVPGAIRMVYDENLNRLYIPGGGQVAIVDVSQSAPVLTATVPITAVVPISRSSGDPCFGTSVTTLNTVDVAPLPDGSRAYAGSYYESAVGSTNYICPQVTVIDAVSNTAESPPIAIPGFAAFDSFCSPTPVAPTARSTRFRIMMAAGGDSSRAYLSSCDGGNVNIIDTATDTYTVTLPAPIGTRTGSPVNLPQNPVFLLAGP